MGIKFIFRLARSRVCRVCMFSLSDLGSWTSLCTSASSPQSRRFFLEEGDDGCDTGYHGQAGPGGREGLGGGERRGTLRNFWWRCAARFSKTFFPYPISDLTYKPSNISTRWVYPISFPNFSLPLFFLSCTFEYYYKNMGPVVPLWLWGVAPTPS